MMRISDFMERMNQYTAISGIYSMVNKMNINIVKLVSWILYTQFSPRPIARKHAMI